MSKDFAIASGFGQQYAQFGKSGMKRAEKHYTSLGKAGKLKGAGDTLKAKVKDNLAAARMVGGWKKGAYNRKKSKR
jgi:hypothetical protein